ncbi:MAG TPA: MoaD/ThiS family protein [Firmicutes bacterium]|jgi:sulfur carrier protein ThiS|nr:MoaD/ThiS family protein [Bacillota bacterium]
MAITIFLEDYFAKKERQCEICANMPVGDLLDQLGYKQYEHYILVNGSFKPHSYILNHGDKVTLIPAPSGG